MSATRLRSRGDRELAEKLQQDPVVQRVIAMLERNEEKSPAGVRRQLLATSLRITPAMMPEVHQDVDACRERLKIETPLEVYLYPSPTFNAAAVKPEQGRLFILLSSSLLEAFPRRERRFVIGHELGHHLYGHHEIPIGYVLRGTERPPPELALRLFAWSRYAEISSDRAGAYCSDNSDDVARALFRLASGLYRPLDDIRIEDFLKQVDDLELEGQELPARLAPSSDWFSTHPFSPLRLKAVDLYFASELARPQGQAVALLEAGVQQLMALMDPSYLKEQSDSAEAARRLLLAGLLAVADADDEITEEEVAVLDQFFGEGFYRDQLDVDAIEQSLEERVAEALERVSHARRIQILRDLCVMARANGEVTAPERGVIEGIARRLEVPLEIVNETLCGHCDLDTSV